MANGGKRPGAGRKPGSKTLVLRDLLKQKDIDTFLEYLLANYMEDTKLMIWMGDHLFTKPRQEVDVTTNGKELPQPIISLGVQSNNLNSKDNWPK